MKEFLEGVVKAFDGPITITVLTIAILFVIFYFAISVLNKNNAKWVILFFVLYVGSTGTIFMLADISGWDYFIVPLLFIVGIVAMFATEIKRDVWNMNSKKSAEIKHYDKGSASGNANDYIDEIVKALQNMSKNDVGAIIILANGNLPKSTIESGVVIDATISSALIESIFFPKTPLHDGAMIINGEKIHAAGCFLSLSEGNQPKELGTRHRAGIGITETVSVTAIIVSEETGIISIAQGGKIKRYADSEMLRQTLREYYWQEFLD